MSPAMASTNWPKIAALKPQLYKHIKLSPQTFRGEQWYLLQDEASGEFSRFNATAYQIIRAMDGKSSCADILSKLQTSYPQNSYTEAHIVLAMQGLEKVNALKRTQAFKASEGANQQTQRRRIKWRQQFANPLAIRLPLYDPDRLLTLLVPRLRFLFTKTAVITLVLLWTSAMYLSLINSHSIAAALNEDILEPQNVLLMTTLFVLLKLLHEFAHALSVKHWGGEVREMGISFLVLAPIPYVDASAAWQFDNKHKRMLVSAMGIIAELSVASLAIIVWLLLEPGWLRSSCLNLAIVASVSTLVFNANPLLKFDAYYILQDWIEIPNLFSKSKQFNIYLLQRYLLRAEIAPVFVHDNRERAWLFFYAVASFFYRLFLLLVISLYLINTLLALGVVLVFWSVYTQLIKPALSAIHYLRCSEAISDNRNRAILASATLCSALLAFFLWFPLPNSTRAQGVVWVAEQAEIYSSQSGFIDEILVPSGSKVTPGTALLKLDSPKLKMQRRKLEAQYRALLSERQAEFVASQGKETLIDEALALLEKTLADKRLEQQELIVRSKTSGVFISPALEQSVGGYAHKGDFIGYVFAPENLMVRSIISQADIGKIRHDIQSVEIRLAEALNQPVSAALSRETPASSHTLPSKALGAAGGGEVAVHSQEDSQTIAIEPYFNLDFSLTQNSPTTRVGGMAYLRIKHLPSPLVTQLERAFRQSFLHRLKL